MSPAAQGESLIDGRVIFEWQISSYFGWGVYGLKPAAQLVEVQGPVAIDLGRVPVDARRGAHASFGGALRRSFGLTLAQGLMRLPSSGAVLFICIL